MSDKNSAFHKAAEFLANDFAEAVAPKLESYYKELEQENARLREALEKITDLHADDLLDMLNITYIALQGKEK